MHRDAPAVLLQDVVKRYGRGESQVEALRGVSLEVKTGERVALLGKSGSGKSTLLNILAGLDRATSGTVVVAGNDLAQLSAKQMARYRSSTVGMIFQSYHLIGTATALRNVELPLVFSRRPKRERRQSAADALRNVGLAERGTHHPPQLSGGEQQRVAIARALMNHPALLLADEPTGNLDTQTAGDIVDLLTGFLNEGHTTFLLVTHDEDLARRIADRVLHIQDGRLVDDVPRS